MQFDFKEGGPLFQQVAAQIELAIFEGNFEEDTQIPSTTEISQSYQINPATVLKGMNLLVEKGILEKRRGLGTFVCVGASKIVQERRQDIFLKQKLPEFLSQAQLLNISSSELIQLIERGYNQ